MLHNSKFRSTHLRSTTTFWNFLEIRHRDLIYLTSGKLVIVFSTKTHCYTSGSELLLSASDEATLISMIQVSISLLVLTWNCIILTENHQLGKKFTNKLDLSKHLVWRDFVFQIVWRFYLWSLNLRMLWNNLQIKTTTLLVFLLWLVKFLNTMLANSTNVGFFLISSTVLGVLDQLQIFWQLGQVLNLISSFLNKKRLQWN